MSEAAPCAFDLDQFNYFAENKAVLDACQAMHNIRDLLEQLATLKPSHQSILHLQSILNSLNRLYEATAPQLPAEDLTELAAHKRSVAALASRIVGGYLDQLIPALPVLSLRPPVTMEHAPSADPVALGRLVQIAEECPVEGLSRHISLGLLKFFRRRLLASAFLDQGHTVLSSYTEFCVDLLPRIAESCDKELTTEGAAGLGMRAPLAMLGQLRSVTDLIYLVLVIKCDISGTIPMKPDSGNQDAGNLMYHRKFPVLDTLDEIAQFIITTLKAANDIEHAISGFEPPFVSIPTALVTLPGEIDHPSLFDDLMCSTLAWAITGDQESELFGPDGAFIRLMTDIARANMFDAESLIDSLKSKSASEIRSFFASTIADCVIESFNSAAESRFTEDGWAVRSHTFACVADTVSSIQGLVVTCRSFALQSFSTAEAIQQATANHILAAVLPNMVGRCLEMVTAFVLTSESPQFKPGFHSLSALLTILNSAELSPSLIALLDPQGRQTVLDAQQDTRNAFVRLVQKYAARTINDMSQLVSVICAPSGASKNLLNTLRRTTTLFKNTSEAEKIVIRDVKAAADLLDEAVNDPSIANEGKVHLAIRILKVLVRSPSPEVPVEDICQSLGSIARAFLGSGAGCLLTEAIQPLLVSNPLAVLQDLKSDPRGTMQELKVAALDEEMVTGLLKWRVGI
ncbi:hypothetical protein J8273_7716 [Carpediemonas membranifera]|uniref:Uncharacterized protein n=1 Tax=Carpediemonas membranifera TaxID=201153 RepID=A0A8J6E1A1_9EUKA|nr:hypothetical protein J8273_7716 [Carpediemonas membranifera]|eukprot:KAG9390367.1 hypothetical protein J8273_7716 [Carpediemonas membranifera]